MSFVEEISGMNKKEKMDFINVVEEDEERFFHDYSEELNILIHDPDNEIKAKAILCLWDYPTTHFLNFLLDAAHDDLGKQVRENSIIVLGRFIFEGSMEGYDLELNNPIATEDITIDDYNKVKNTLLNIYKDNKRTVDDRRLALEALSFSSEDEIEELIKDAYNNKDKSFKQSAIFSMGRNGNIRWNDIILIELKNTDTDLQREAIKAAGEGKVDKAGPELLKLTYSDDPDIVKLSAWSLGQTGWEDAFNRLYELSESKDHEIQVIADEAIEEWHSICGNDDDYFDDEEDYFEDEPDH